MPVPPRDTVGVKVTCGRARLVQCRIRSILTVSFSAEPSATIMHSIPGSQSVWKGTWPFPALTSFGPGFLPGGFGCGSGPCTTEIDWLATARGRAGLTFDRLFIFASGGVAAAGVESQIENTTDFQISETSVGWTVGGGAEYAFSDRWSAKLEYLHVDLGDTDAAANGFFTTNELDIVRGGINFHF